MNAPTTNTVPEHRNTGPSLRIEFVRALAARALAGDLRLADGDRPGSGHAVATDFLSVAVASSPDPATDAYVIACLGDLGIRHVRLDFSYGDADRHVGRFLDRLCESGLRVSLHLVQPADAARRMEHPDAQAEWQAFVHDTLERWATRIEMIEIGSTVNRKRWAGHSLAGFLAAWQIAHPLVRAHGLRLAGPNVTDFEPPWNIGLLAMLGARRCLPDVHTNNLFSERCTEPERFDHKILGHRLAGLHRFNLIKKARLLQHIGARAGVPVLHSPAAFWTLPRIERLLQDGEQKQADYLSRYFLLCAASGALERVGWGPLICHREGLVDDDGAPYPALERITHYASVSGSVADFRRRPAFQACAGIAALIPGSRYTGRVPTAETLEVHAFLRAEEQVHAVWTRNGAAVALHDLYDADDLASARCLTRDGRELPEAPPVIGESPHFLLWPASRTLRVQEGAAPLRDVRIHAHEAGGRYHVHEDDRWRGMIHASSPQDARLLLDALHPERIGAPPSDRLLRKARNAVWTVADPRGGNTQLVVKQPIRIPAQKRLLDRFKPSKGLRSWNATAELARRGLKAAAPVAWFEERVRTDLTLNWFICAFVPGELSLRDLFAAYAQGAVEHAGYGRDEVFDALGGFLVRMHGRGVFFRDLSGGNLLVGRDAQAHPTFTLIDTGRARFHDHATPVGERIADLSRVCNKLDRASRRQLIERYEAGSGLRLGLRTTVAFGLYDLKVAFKRRLRRNPVVRWLKR